MEKRKRTHSNSSWRGWHDRVTRVMQAIWHLIKLPKIYSDDYKIYFFTVLSS